MAVIEKIYGTKKERLLLIKWLEANRPDALQHIYKEEEVCYSGNIALIAHFPQAIDKWLLDNCPLDFVQEQISKQYGLKRKAPKPRYHNRSGRGLMT